MLFIDKLIFVPVTRNSQDTENTIFTPNLWDQAMPIRHENKDYRALHLQPASLMKGRGEEKLELEPKAQKLRSWHLSHQDYGKQ